MECGHKYTRLLLVDTSTLAYVLGIALQAYLGCPIYASAAYGRSMSRQHSCRHTYLDEFKLVRQSSLQESPRASHTIIASLC